MNRIPQLETTRLSLDAVQIEDAKDIYIYAQNPNVLRYTTGKTPSNPSETETFVQGLVSKPPGAYAWSIRRKEYARVIGVIEFGTQEDGAEGSIDYAMAEEFWNQGIMTEAIRAVLDWAFRTRPFLNMVSSSAMTANPASTRVQQKCGMRPLRHEYSKWDKFAEPVELAICAITREDLHSSDS
jgi:[ribosomal protein S5]-alanine N-acetyltransferase